MSRQVLVVLGHPCSDSLCAGLATAYADAARAAGAQVRVLRLGSLVFDPLLHAGYRQVQTLEPDLVAAQQDILWAQHLVWVYPIWWGAMPALLKGFIDRAQIFWEQRREGTRTPRRPAHAVLCAARTRGDRLFEANLLILRCFLDTLGFSLHEPLLLRGVERPDDLLHPHLIAQIERFGLEAAEQATRLHHE